MNLAVLRKALGLVLRKNPGAVHGDFKASTGGRQQVQRFDLMFELKQQLFRQTDGVRLVVSGGAVFDGNCHRFLSWNFVAR